MADLTRALTLSSPYVPDEGATYWTWAITEDEHEQIFALLGRPANVERYQTAAELEASNRLVDTFEVPPIERY